MKIDGDIHIGADRLSHGGKVLSLPLHKTECLDRARQALVQAGLESVEPFRNLELHGLRVTAAGIDPDAISRRAAEQFVHRNPERLALDVPQRLIDAA